MVRLCLPARFTVCFSLWLAIAALYIIRSNISVAILSMVKQTLHKDSKSFTSCNQYNKKTTVDATPELTSANQYDWSESIQANILSGFFQGYASTHLIGSILSALIGPRRLLIISLLGSSLIAFFTPYITRWHPYALIASRILTGMFSGPLYPIIQEVLGAWTPVSERTILAALTHSGNIFGLVGNYGVGAIMCGGHGGPHGWEYFFYFSGIVGAVSCFLWIMFGYDRPSSHPCIGKNEITYISGPLSSNKNAPSFKQIPFKKIFTCPKVIAATSAHFAHLLIFYALITGHAKFLKDAYEFSTRDASLISMIPFVTNFIVQLVYPPFVDYLRVRKGVDITIIRKATSAVAFLGGSLFLSIVGFLGCERKALVVVFMSISLGFIGLNASGYLTASIDIAPRYAGIVMGFMNTFGSSAGFIAPLIAGKFLEDGDKLHGWRHTFLIEAAIAFVLGYIFVIFGSSSLQDWADEVEYKPIAHIKLAEREHSIEMTNIKPSPIEDTV